MLSQLNSIIDTLSLDHKRGAAEIVKDVIDLLINISSLAESKPDISEQLFRRAVKRLTQGQPSMAPVLNCLNAVCLAWERCADNWEMFKTELEHLDLVRTAQVQTLEEQIEKLPRVDGNLLTFSNSSTTAQTIISCHNAGWNMHVFCGEGRPVMEGVLQAKKLHRAGVPVTLLTDAALMSRITEVQAVWVGGDSLSYEGLVNKVGSKALAMLAKRQSIPFISMMGLDKLLSSDLYPFLKFLPQNPREVTADDADDLVIINEYYERIPLDMVDYIFTQDGLDHPRDLLDRKEHLPLSRAFTEMVQDI